MGLLFLLSAFFRCSSFLCRGFLLLLVHGSGDEEVDNRLGKNITVVVKLKLAEDVVNLVLIELVSKGGQNVDEVILVEDVSLHHLALDLLLNFFIESLKCAHNKVIGIVDTTGPH